MYLRKIKNKWQCQIQVNEVRQSKIFLSKKSAGRWGIDTIKKIHQGVNLEKVNTPLHEKICSKGKVNVGKINERLS